MKNIKKLIILGISLITIFSFFNCDTTLALGKKLNLAGPLITITAPAPRKAVTGQFTIEGTAQDVDGVDLMLIKPVINNQDYQRQWRYYKGLWYISDNSGADWALYSGGSWTGDPTDGTWSVVIDMVIGTNIPSSGEYTFVVQAWGTTGLTDDNSFKTLVLIYDNNPPSVRIVDPFIYREGLVLWDQYLELDAIPDSSDEWMEPANIGKFITNDFNLQWQIDDQHDIWSIEIKLYDKDSVQIDELENTPLPDGELFRHYINLPPPPAEPSPDVISPNGNILVTGLGITEKTTIMAVGLCYDAAGNVNEERILGYFIYWPKADNPWIIYPQGMSEHYSSESEVYLAYPGREIKPTAYQARGVLKVEYEIFKLSAWNGVKGDFVSSGSMENEPRFGGIYSNIFPWEFLPPLSTGNYLIEAEVFCEGKSLKYNAGFFVQDTSFPDFPEPPDPSASLPFYRAIGQPDSFGNATPANSIRIHGTVSDATEVTSLYLVWINPESRGFAAMSQLSYFRDANYDGWKSALSAAPGTYVEEGLFDDANKNKVWKLALSAAEMNYTTDRWTYKYSQLIDLTADLNIAADNQPMKSQIFLLKVANPDNKNTIITYAPQGDESPPILTIDNVNISSSRDGVPDVNCEPGKYALIEQFEDGDVITIDGTWIDDSIEYLAFEDYFRNNFEVKVNTYTFTYQSSLVQNNVTMSFTPSLGKVPGGTGKWKVVITVGSGSHTVQTSSMKDNLVVSATVFDIGKNPAEAQGSWLIKSDTLRLLRISSEDTDRKYTNPSKITIYLEFNKPVELKSGRSTPPQLTLNVTDGTNIQYATYKPNTIQSTRQYFEYDVEANHRHTGTDEYLDVTGLRNLAAGTYWTADGYPFTWVSGADDANREEIRVTMNVAHYDAETQAGITGGPNLYYRRLPVRANAADELFTLMRSKKIEVDTTRPTVSSVSSTNPSNFYSLGAVINIDVKFSEQVRISSPYPQLQLYGLGNTTGTPRVNGDTITFSYTVASGNTTSGDEVVINGITDMPSIQDFAGNSLNTLGGNRTLAGIRVEAQAPGVPLLKLKNAAANTHNSTTLNIVSNNVGGTNINGYSTGQGFAPWTSPGPTQTVDLTNVYNDELWIAIDGNVTGGAYKLNALEYSIKNGAEGTWVRAPGPYTGNYFVLKLENFGEYQITTRQIDSAGNVSNWSQPVNFNWDPGNIVTRITSTSSNDTYTANAGKNTINITLHFRKSLYFVNSFPTLQLNVTSNGATTGNIRTVTADAGQANSFRNSLSYTYTVSRTDNTTRDGIPNGGTAHSNLNLDVTGITGTTGITVRDGDGNTGVNVASMITLPAAGSNNRLGENKQIKIDTSALTVATAPVFAGSIQSDGTWSGTMTMTFSQSISRGTGDITIIQYTENTDADRYRIPAVMTEAQFNRYRTLTNINSYYTRGTNGYNYVSAADRGPDTSTKYVLAYSNNTATINPNGSGTGIAKFAEDLRQAEAVKLSVNSTQSVQISGSTLTVQLTGSNALQVPGARYTVSFSPGFVQDSLGNQIATYTNTTASAVSGVAKPAIRVRKTQDTITRNATISGTTPRWSSVQPLTTEVRFDCRTPGSTVYYTTNSAETSVSNDNWSYNGTPTDTNTPAAPNQPGAISTTSATANPVTIGGTTNGATTTISNVQGLQWFVRARGYKGTTWSTDSYEMAFRTVITLRLNNITAADTGIVPPNGSHIWVRGGDAISSSNTPGFPLTWEDDWNELNGKRAGIRMLQKTGTANLNNDTYKFVNWEINTTAYVDFILGYDENATTSDGTQSIVWQYGPRQWALNRAGWASYKDTYPIYPGKHRYMTTANVGKGEWNFSGTYSARPNFTANSGWTGPNTTTATPQ